MCLSTMKNLLAKVVYPFVESPSTDTKEIHFLLRHVVGKRLDKDNQVVDVSVHRGLVKELFQALSSSLPRVTNLIGADVVSMSDSIIIQAVYIAIGPFFIVEGNDGDTKNKKDGSLAHTVFGSSAMRGLRMDALSLVRSVSIPKHDLYEFASHIIAAFVNRFSRTTKNRDSGLLKKSSPP